MSKRVAAFKTGLIAEIPRFPNNKASLQTMSSKSLTDVLIKYIDWRHRFIGQRPRTASVRPEAIGDPRWSIWGTQVEKLLVKVRAGDDLTPHLSLDPKTRGYTPASSGLGASVEERWSDKDQVLNVMGFHHLHLGDVATAVHADRSDELIFCRVDRDSFEVVAIFDHGVFKPGTAERSRLHQLHFDLLTANASPGTAVLMSQLTSAGTTIQATFTAQGLVELIHRIDPMLDDPHHASALVASGITVQKPEKLRWEMMHLDLGLYDKAGNRFFLVQKGPA